MKRGLFFGVLFLLIFLFGCTSYNLNGNAIYTGKAVSTGSLEITSNPSGANVIIDELVRGHTPLTVTGLTQGGHSVVLDKGCQGNFKKYQQIKAGETAVLDVVLQKFGDATITSNPSGAKVYLTNTNNKNSYKGLTPITLKCLDQTNNKVKVVKNSYLDKEKTFGVPVNEKISVHFLLTSLSQSSTILQISTGTLDVGSVPDGASIFVGSNNLGNTKATIDLIPGSYNVVIKKAGYSDYQTVVNVLENKVTPMNVQLEQLGGIFVLTTPPGASIYLDNIYKGQTAAAQGSSLGSLTIENVKPGLHVVKISKLGYGDKIVNAEVVGGQTYTINEILSPASTGTLKVSSSPLGAKKADVYIDYAYKGKTPLTSGISYLTISGVLSGQHTVTVKKTGYLDYTTVVELDANEIEIINAQLSTA